MNTILPVENNDVLTALRGFLRRLVDNGVVDAIFVQMQEGANAVPALVTDPALLEFEKTTSLVDSGIYRYIRHPMYSSLLFLAWGIFLKHPGAGLFAVVLFTSLSLLETALTDEKECVAYFGNTYKDYMKRTSRFIPFIF